jgi:hypothetical protein
MIFSSPQQYFPDTASLLLRVNGQHAEVKIAALFFQVYAGQQVAVGTQVLQYRGIGMIQFLGKLAGIGAVLAFNEVGLVGPAGAGGIAAVGAVEQ